LHRIAVTAPDALPLNVYDDAALIISELVTNSIRAGGRVIEVRLLCTLDMLRVCVFDDAPGIPRLLATGPREDHGRGLALVDALSAGWGVEPALVGKEVWAELGWVG
jgi:anti-sigma regulatory factor (Ser/Thr protein kinase)